MALQEDLADRQRDELGVGDLFATARAAACRKEIVRQHVSPVSRLSRSAWTRPPPAFDCLIAYAPVRGVNSESVI
jgi:hypothetical protein